MIAISDEVTTRMVDHLRHSTTDMAETDLRVPVANFVSDAHAESERALFRRLPLNVAHCSELPAVGSFITRDVLGTSLIIVRQGDGTVAAYRNMCRHRGGKVEQEASGNKRVFVCQYHGWSYARDGGGLLNVPYGEFFDSIDRACSGLARVGAEERHGLIWIDLSNDPEGPVADYLGPQVDAMFASFNMEQSIVFLDKSFTLDINWKLVVDGAIDVLHPLFLHPDSVGKLFQTNAGVWKDYGRHGQLFTARRRLVELVKSGEPIKAAWKYFATNLLVYPNTFLIAAPDHIEFWTVWPATDSASRCTINIRFIVRQDILDDEIAARITRSWEILKEASLNEDWPMEATIQANSRAHPDGAFLYGRNEIPCQHLHRQLRKDIGDADGCA